MPGELDGAGAELVEQQAVDLSQVVEGRVHELLSDAEEVVVVP